MIDKFQLLRGGIAVLVFAAAPHTSTAASAGPAVYVVDVEQLYAAVNDPLNVGASVFLAPGIYLLSPLARPNGGRLELQHDMSLYGVAGDRTAAVIDATALPASSFSMPFGRTGVIRTGRGSNAVEWLTIAGNPLAAAAVETDLVGTPETRIRVAHVVAGNSARGVDIRNIGVGMARRRIDAEIVDSEFFGGIEGIRVINLAGADYGDIGVAMHGNRSYENRLGCIVENNRSSFARIHVRSSGDRFEDNGLGCQIGGGLVVPLVGAANSNSVVFEGHGTGFINNNKRTGFCDECQGPTFIDFGGVVVAGGDALARANSTSSNTVMVKLWGCRVAENVIGAGIDFQAFGARSDDPSGIAGTDNHVTIELHGVSKQIDVVAVDSSPEDPSGTNTVTVLR